MVTIRIATAALAFALTACPIAAAERRPTLPQSVPVPEVIPPPAGNVPPEKLGGVPLPEERPDKAGDDAGKPAAPPPPDAKAAPRDAEPVTPADVPVPPPAPDEAPGAAKESPNKAMQPDARSTAVRPLLMPREEVLCRQRLRAAGVAFEDRPAEHGDVGCDLPWPVSVSSLGNAVDIEPDVLVDCGVAEATARFTAQTIAPAAKRAFASDLAVVGQASGYVCRPRNGTNKLSEHAFGNAIDLSTFRMKDGRTAEVSLTPDAATAAFLKEVRAAACGPFKTVLGPGSDADHASHLHLDLAPRRNGGTVCE
jgi:hypothetical protein